MSLLQSDYWLQEVLNTGFLTTFRINTYIVRLFSNNLAFDHTTPYSAFVECTFPGYASQPVGTLNAPVWNGTYWQLTAVSMLTFTDTGAGPDNVYGYYVTPPTGHEWLWAQSAPSAPIVLGTSQPALAVLPTWGYTDIP